MHELHCNPTSIVGREHGLSGDHELPVTGQRPPESQLIGHWKGKYKPEVWKHYQSHTQGGVATEVAPDSRGSIWKTPAVLAIPAAIIAVPILIGSIDFTGGAVEKAPPVPLKPAAQASIASAPQASPSPAGDKLQDVPPDAPKKPTEQDSESSRWTLLGVAQKEDGTGYALVQTSLGLRRIFLDKCGKPGPEWECMIDGRRVTAWTGGVWRTLGRVDPVRQ